jgi:hypothetical protein
LARIAFSTALLTEVERDKGFLADPKLILLLQPSILPLSKGSYSALGVVLNPELFVGRFSIQNCTVNMYANSF